jgi:hypothetical protein
VCDAVAADVDVVFVGVLDFAEQRADDFVFLPGAEDELFALVGAFGVAEQFAEERDDAVCAWFAVVVAVLGAGVAAERVETRRALDGVVGAPGGVEVEFGPPTQVPLTPLPAMMGLDRKRNGRPVMTNKPAPIVFDQQMVTWVHIDETMRRWGVDDIVVRFRDDQWAFLPDGEIMEGPGVVRYTRDGNGRFDTHVMKTGGLRQ